MASFTPPTDEIPAPVDSTASQLQQVQSIPGAPRTKASSFATINDLPVEILRYIFTFAWVYCKLNTLLEHEDPQPSSLDNVSAVCVYWHNLCIDTPLLWSHVDLDISRRFEKSALYVQCSLKRAKQLPLHVHIDDHYDLRGCGPQPAIALLAPYANRIVSLDLVVNAYMAQSLLLGLFDTNYKGTVLDLRLYDCDYVTPIDDGYDGGSSLIPAGALDAFLLSLQSLSLHSPVLEYSSPAFRGLTELTIMLMPRVYFRPNPDELVYILASCSTLRSLALVGVKLKGQDLPVKIAHLPSLEILDLHNTAFKDVLLITSFISPGACALSMSVSLSTSEDTFDGGDLFPLWSFFQRSRIKPSTP
ncbi:hypothetical protein BDV93DRAFT_540686 [Ceratobasidium sp. AG-I]|nr:hypothetical protein BDV93DRAFT_540686 [Ceratobasidium sp. AG-I]